MAADEEDATLKSVARLLYNTALLESGFQPEDVKDFGTSVHMLVKDSIGVESDLKEVEEVGGLNASAGERGGVEWTVGLGHRARTQRAHAC